MIAFPLGVLRLPTMEDLAAFARQADDPGIWANLRMAYPDPYTIEHALSFHNYLHTQSPPSGFLIEHHGEPVGAIAFSRDREYPDSCAEIGFWLGATFQRRGIMTGALAAISEYGFRTLGLLRIEGTVFPWNPPSSKVFERCGYLCEGVRRCAAIKAGKPADLITYALINPDWKPLS